MEIPQALELIEKSGHVAIIVPDAQTMDAVAAAEALCRTLKHAEKNVGVIITDKKPISHPNRFTALAQAQPLMKEFIVSLDTSHSPVSQLRYENLDGKIDVIFSPRTTSVSNDAVSFREGKTLCDAIITVGVPDPEMLDGDIAFEPNFFTETPTINIDISEKNTHYGEANLVDSEKSSLSEISYELSSALKNGPLDAESATILLAGIVNKTENFTAAATTSATFLAASELMRLGAHLEDASKIASFAVPLDLLQLLGRSSVRTKTGNDGVLWSFLTADDFIKTNRSPQDIPAILNHLKRFSPARRLQTILWQNPATSSVHATLAGDQTLLETIADRGIGKFQSPHLLLTVSYETFRDAEERIAQLLRAIL